MYSPGCWRFRRSLTRYVDGELPPDDATAVQRHLAKCAPCLERVRVEDAVRHTLRERTARAGSSAWLPTPPVPARPTPVNRSVRTVALATGFVIVFALWGSRSFQATPLEAVGLISDSNCNGLHRPAEAPDADPASCTQGCIRNG